MSYNAIRENKILTEISEFTIIEFKFFIIFFKLYIHQQQVCIKQVHIDQMHV